jgi:hypothetical protein
LNKIKRENSFSDSPRNEKETNKTSNNHRLETASQLRGSDVFGDVFGNNSIVGIYEDG